MRVALTDQDDPMTAGFIGSIVFHIFIVLAIIFGVPSFFEPEILPQPLGIEAAIVSDITAAPKVDKPSNKKPDKPKEQPAPEKEKPKTETPPPTPAAPPPPPPPEPQAVAIPDPAQKPIEKKPEEKKVDKPKEKEKKAEDKAFEEMLKNLNKSQPAPEPTAKPKNKATPPPAEPSSGPQTPLASEVPMTASDQDGIKAQIVNNWNPASFIGAPDLDTIVVEMRVTLLPDGTVTNVQILNTGSSPFFRAVAESARRAVRMSSPLKLPPGKSWPTIALEFRPAEAFN